MDNNQINRLAELAKYNTECFAQLYEITFPEVYKFVYWKINDIEITEDLVSDIYETILKKLKTFDKDKATFKTWMYRIARNKTYDYFRKNKKVKNITITEDIENTVDASSVVCIEERLLIENIKTCIKGFSEKEQEIFSLKYLLGFRNKEIAQALQIKERTVSSSLSKIIKKIRERI